MDFTKLFEMQKQLDETINLKHNTSYKTTLNSRILAFFVELGEFANETRCFKYWSNKLPSPKEIQLEEYIDGLHFIMSIGLAINIDNYNYEPIIQYNNLVDQLNYLIDKVSLFNNFRNKYNYTNMFNAFLGVGKICNFEYEDLLNAYYSKNKINYNRQDNNY